MDNPDLIAGYDLQSRSNWGKGYKAIRNEFETHLRTAKLAATVKEAIVMAQLFLPRFPIEFRIRDIPEDLAYRSSVVWVNFVNGVNFVNAVSPELLYRLSFQQLVNVPMHRAEVATTEEVNLINLTRLLQRWIGPSHLVSLRKKPSRTTRKPTSNAPAPELEKHSKRSIKRFCTSMKSPPNACPLPRLK